MRYCIDSSILGTEKHLVRSDGGYAWTNEVPDETWHLTGQLKESSDWCLDTLFKLNDKHVNFNPESKYVSMMRTVTSGSNVSVIPWQKVMPTAAHRTFTKGIIAKVEESMVAASEDYYRSTWGHGGYVLRNLKRARVDEKRLEQLENDGVQNMAPVLSFKPDRGDMTKQIVYDRHATLTGRLTVKSGPMILTLKREHRDLIIPKNFGNIVYMDFSALEVRILLYEAGRICMDPDIYSYLASELKKERNIVKGAVISELYGSSLSSLEKLLNVSKDELLPFVEKVKTYFNTKDLLERLKPQLYETGMITNRYGRRIKIDKPMDHVLINYYAQSTGVDVALMGFSKIVKDLKKTAPGVRPLFVLHDALLLDVPEEHLETVMNVNSVKVPGYVQNFYLKTECMHPQNR